MQTKFSAFFNPERFQGWGKTKNYFEGWYFKVVNEDASKAFAFIPGVAMDANANGHAFIQVLDGKAKTAEYHRFDLQTFSSEKDRFEIEIAGNRFSEKGIQLKLPDLEVNLSFSGNIPWPKPWYSPGIMGPFAYVPFMECYHGIVSMNHTINGYIKDSSQKYNFDKGRGYLEKDWGKSFPEAYFWMQSNHFEEAGISMKASVAKIPFMGSSFVGFISGFWLRDRLIRFTTYNQTKLRKSFANEQQVEIVLENRKNRLEILAHRDGATSLPSPIQGAMEGRIEESMTATLEVQLSENKQIIFEGKGKHAGLEVAGKIKELFK